MSSVTVKNTLLNDTVKQYVLDDRLKDLIKKWDEPRASGLQLLECLDACIYQQWGNRHLLDYFMAEYNSSLSRERRTHAQNEKQAYWRNKS